MDKVDILLSELSLHDEYDKMSNDAVELLRVDAIDRWTWDTGSKEDAELIIKLEREMNWRNRNSKRIKKEAAEKDAEEALMAFIAEETRDEIDRDIMRGLFKIIDTEKN